MTNKTSSSVSVIDIFNCIIYILTLFLGHYYKK